MDETGLRVGLDRYWAALNDREQAQLLPLTGQDVMPDGLWEPLEALRDSRLITRLASWTPSTPVQYYVGDALADFLDQKRRESN
jgi:hypothetical protein